MQANEPLTVRTAQPEDVERIAVILASSFSELFRAEFGLRQAEVTSLLSDLYGAAVLPLDKVRIATVGARVVGVAVLSLPGHAPNDGSWLRNAWPIFRRRMGWRGALRAAIGSGLLRYYFAGRTPIAGEAYIDSLAVVEEFRRRGVGRALVENCCLEATRSDCREIGLHVLKVKSGARSLYESCGFQVEEERRWMARASERSAAILERITRRTADEQRSVLMVKRL